MLNARRRPCARRRRAVVGSALVETIAPPEARHSSTAACAPSRAARFRHARRPARPVSTANGETPRCAGRARPHARAARIGGRGRVNFPLRANRRRSAGRPAPADAVSKLEQARPTGVAIRRIAAEAVDAASVRVAMTAAAAQRATAAAISWARCEVAVEERFDADYADEERRTRIESTNIRFFTPCAKTRVDPRVQTLCLAFMQPGSSSRRLSREVFRCGLLCAAGFCGGFLFAVNFLACRRCRRRRQQLAGAPCRACRRAPPRCAFSPTGAAASRRPAVTGLQPRLARGLADARSFAAVGDVRAVAAVQDLIAAVVGTLRSARFAQRLRPSRAAVPARARVRSCTDRRRPCSDA